VRERSKTLVVELGAAEEQNREQLEVFGN